MLETITGRVRKNKAHGSQTRGVLMIRVHAMLLPKFVKIGMDRNLINTGRVREKQHTRVLCMGHVVDPCSYIATARSVI